MQIFVIASGMCFLLSSLARAHGRCSVVACTFSQQEIFLLCGYEQNKKGLQSTPVSAATPQAKDSESPDRLPTASNTHARKATRL